ncbi:MAG TPA: hypothetical protein VFQ25_14220 [Ktedonobacterales bacterium]|nr:hypothetical protein [Ktedonobacterales bacterium]
MLVKHGLHWFERRFHVAPHRRPQRLQRLIYLLAERRMRGLEHAIYTALQSLARWLNHDIGLLLGNGRDMGVETGDHALQRLGYQLL